MAKPKSAATKKREVVQRAVKKAGVAGLDKPKMTPSHPKKKGVVVTMVDGKPKTIRFGEQGAPHNYSPGARKGFKARHAKNIARGKSSPAYWADKVLWSKGGRVKKPK